MRKIKVIAAVQLPPPVHGSSVMNQSLIQDATVQDKLNMKVLPIQMATRLEDLNNFSLTKVLRALKVYVQFIVSRFTFRPDMCYITLSPKDFAFYKDAILVFLAKVLFVKRVIHLHGQGIKDITAASRWKTWLYRAVLSNCEIICLSPRLVDDIRHLVTREPFVLNNGVKVSEVDTQLDRPVDFLYFASIAKSKGAREYINALGGLHRKGLDFQAVIAGGPKDISKEQILELVHKHGIEDKVRVDDPVYGEAKYRLFERARIYVLPSYIECFPLTIIEALQTGCAVISTRTGGIPDLLGDAETGLLATPQSEEELQGAMEKLLADDALVKQMGQLGIERFHQQYVWTKFIENYLNIIEQVNGK